LAQYLRGNEYWERGLDPPSEATDALTVADMCNHFLQYNDARRNAGALAVRSYRALYDTCARLVKVLGKARVVKGLTPGDFGKLKAALARGRKAVSLRYVELGKGG
jgi:hypothetical protein